MVVLVSRVSKGTLMDQVYIPKERVPGFEVGTAVLIESVIKEAKPKLFYYGVSHLEPVKVRIIEEVVNYLESFDNVLICGSFLEPGFGFEDVDVVLITDNPVDEAKLRQHFLETLGLRVQVIAMSFKTLLKGVSSDPLFEMLIGKFVAKRRVIFRVEREIKYKLLDLHLLKSELLIINFHSIAGREKYKLVRNLFAIALFLDGKKVSAESVDEEINAYFGKGTVESVRENIVDKSFLTKYKRFYGAVFKKIMAGIGNGSKQKQAS